MSATAKAVIDIGTNSVKLLVARAAHGRVEPLEEISDQTRLGRGFYQTRRLQSEAVRATAAAVANFARRARESGVSSIRAIATSAAREAVNAEELIAAVRAASGLEVEIISGDAEARWAYLGVATDPELTARPLLIADIGGGSAEFILGAQGTARFALSFPLGTVRLLESIALANPPSAENWADCRSRLERQFSEEIAPQLVPALQQPTEEGEIKLVATGGTATLLARILVGSSAASREELDGRLLSRAFVRETRRRLWALPLEERQKTPGLPANRADVILMGVAIIETLMEKLQFDELRVSLRGIRYAALIA